MTYNGKTFTAEDAARPLDDNQRQSATENTEDTEGESVVAPKRRRSADFKEWKLG